MPDPKRPEVRRTVDEAFSVAYSDLAASRSKRPAPTDVRDMEPESIEVDSQPEIEDSDVD